MFVIINIADKMYRPQLYERMEHETIFSCMKLCVNSLRMLIREAIDAYKDSPLVPERPWNVKLPFTLKSKGGAMDSEGESSDGIKLLLVGKSASVSVIADTYWNPHSGDESGNSIVIVVDDKERVREHFPRKLDDDEKHVITVSCSPWQDKLFIGIDDFIICSIDVPWEDEDQIKPDWEPVMEKDYKRIKCDGPETSSL